MNSLKHSYPKGYKQYRVLRFINEKPQKYTDIVKFAYELTHGHGTFDKRNNRGYWSSVLGSGCYYRKPGWVYQMTNNSRGEYVLNAYGKRKLIELEHRFGGMSKADAVIHKMLLDEKRQVKKSERNTHTESLPEGLVPRDEWEQLVIQERLEERMLEVQKVIQEYVEKGLLLNPEWISEYNKLVEVLRK